MTQTPGGEPPAVENGLPARPGEQRLDGSVARRGMFGARTTGDTSGYGRLQVHRLPPLAQR